MIDEADRILQIGFEEEMKQIIRLLPSEYDYVLCTTAVNYLCMYTARSSLQYRIAGNFRGVHFLQMANLQKFRSLNFTHLRDQTTTCICGRTTLCKRRSFAVNREDLIIGLDFNYCSFAGVWCR